MSLSSIVAWRQGSQILRVACHEFLPKNSTGSDFCCRGTPCAKRLRGPATGEELVLLPQGGLLPRFRLFREWILQGFLWFFKTIHDRGSNSPAPHVLGKDVEVLTPREPLAQNPGR